MVVACKKIGINMESLALIEPLLPAEGNHILIDLATQLWVESTALSSNLHFATIRGIGDLVRLMFFLSTCIDQVQFMRSSLEPQQLLARIEVYVEEEIVTKLLLPGSRRVVTEVFRVGELDRGQAAAISGYQERQGRKVLKRLLESGLLISDTPKGAVRVGFPSTLLERYFPRLFLG